MQQRIYFDDEDEEIYSEENLEYYGDEEYMQGEVL
jgi:hypothetical protein